jgi:hypothetical protein
MTKIKDLHKIWMKDAAYRKEYDALEEEFTVMAAIAKARRRAGLSQAELARRMKTTQSHRGPARKRTRPALHAHAGAVRKSDGTPAQDQFSADAEGISHL